MCTECTENPITTTTTMSSVSAPVQPESTTSIQHGSGGQQGYEIGNGTWCFQCEDMTHLQFCDIVTRCNSNEVCYIQKYTRSHKFHLFRSGCMHANKCHSLEDLIGCQQCCHGNFCNVMGCGDDGLPNFDSRGPICFDCAHQGQDDFCQSVHMCRPDQVCKIEKFEWGSDYHYVMGCADDQVCISKRDIQARYAPSAPNVVIQTFVT
ncbi:uncharacterized protein LOC128551540 [Mercenaria mercenaria]|uniref:uncharacterized protein LOC128551540 n=1 Tax=Mercenaria mercenaria TaxID=6596 RepID=UPI00234F34CA|nr:uncharacterized protein LOC128551540 [Mercenaria mercenaria]